MLKAVRRAARTLRNNPTFTLVAICSLAIGIGATSAIFSFADALLLRPLPVLEPSRVVAVTTDSSVAFGLNAGISARFAKNERRTDDRFPSSGRSSTPSMLT